MRDSGNRSALIVRRRSWATASRSSGVRFSCCMTWNQSGLQWRQGTPGKDARTMGPEVSEKPLRFSAAARRIFGSSYETLKLKRL
jgi:hypothetical protein